MTGPRINNSPIGAGPPASSQLLPSHSATPKNELTLEQISKHREHVGAADVRYDRGDDTTFEVMKYPLDLGFDEHPHYVMFYVQVRRSDISAAENKSKTVPFNIDESRSNRPSTELSALKVLTNAVVPLATGAVVGSAVKAVTGSELLETGGRLVGAAFGVGLDIGGFGSSLAEGRTKVMLRDTIALYLNGKPSSQYRASWADQDLGVAGGAAGAVGSLIEGISNARGEGEGLARIGDAASKKWTAAKAGLKGLGGAVGAALLKGSDKLKSDTLGDVGATIKSGLAVTPNPFKAQLFNTMGFRTFTFDYTFLPKNAAEYVQVKKIVQTFKRYMHPTLGADKFIMNYPAEWNIVYYYKDVVNEELFRIANCALTNLKVEYGGTDFTTFKRIPGAATEVSMKLEFTELELLTQDRIMEGY